MTTALDPTRLTVNVLNCLVIIIHIVTLTLLKKLNHRSLCGNQKEVLITLCVTELSYAIVYTACSVLYWKEIYFAYVVFMLFLHAAVIPAYMALMILITVDRFLIFFLNLKYDLHWSRTKNRIALVLMAFIALLFFISILIYAWEGTFYISSKFVHIQSTLVTYIYPIFQGVFVIFAVFTYSFIFVKHKKSVRARQSGNATNIKSHNQFKTIVPTLIILTYFFSAIIPGIIQLFILFSIIPSTQVSNSVIFIFISLGLIADPLIYIFNIRAVQKIIKQKFKKAVPVQVVRHNGNQGKF